MSLVKADKDNIFGERLRYYRTQTLKQTQKEFSDYLGLPQPTLSAYESGRNKPTVDVLIRIADKCEVSMDWLCGRDKPEHICSLGDIVNVLFELNEVKEIQGHTVLHDKVDYETTDETNDEKRNWVALKYYSNERWHSPEDQYSADLCFIIRTVDKLYQDLVSYAIPQDYYDSQKEYWIKEYSKYPVTKVDFSAMTHDERMIKSIQLFRKKHNLRVGDGLDPED